MNTAQARFKEGYSKYIAEAFAATLVVHFLVFYLVPPFEFTPYVPEISWTTILVPEPPPEPVIEEIDKVKQPEIDHIPIIDEGAGDEDIDMPITSPDKLRDIHVFALPTEKPAPFVAWDAEPVLLRAVTPVYPSLARDAGIEGKVLLRVTIGTDGRVKTVSIIRSDVTPAMEKAAMAAVMRFEFKPAMQQTIPVRAQVAVPVWFRLH